MIEYSIFRTIASTLIIISLGYSNGGKPVIDHLCTFQLHAQSFTLFWCLSCTLSQLVLKELYLMLLIFFPGAWTHKINAKFIVTWFNTDAFIHFVLCYEDSDFIRKWSFAVVYWFSFFFLFFFFPFEIPYLFFRATFHIAVAYSGFYFIHTLLFLLHISR